jgi:hypothetical protein
MNVELVGREDIPAGSRPPFRLMANGLHDIARFRPNASAALTGRAAGFDPVQA